MTNSSSGQERKIYKRLSGLVEEKGLKSEIAQIKKDFDKVIGVFGKQLYKYNCEELRYSEMGERISKQRNNFAHGNLDREFIGNSLLDLKFTEYIICAL